jgi:hypothetical protein
MTIKAMTATDIRANHKKIPRITLSRCARENLPAPPEVRTLALEVSKAPPRGMETTTFCSIDESVISISLTNGM